jgi:methylglutaconyl-CoA hydratase
LSRTQNFLTSLRQTLQDLEDLPIPTIAAIAGPAFGGGLELALPLDFRVLASTATLALPETRLGIIPGAGGTYRLQRLIGTPRARDLILTGRRIGGPEAYFLGIADRLVEVTEEVKGKAREMVLEAAVRLAREIAEGAPLAERAAKRAIREASWEAESRAYEEVVGTEDRDEALAAFQEKRKPVFKGR